MSFDEAPFTIIDGDRGANYPKQNDFSSDGHCLFLNAGNVTSDGFSFADCTFISKEKDSALRKGKLSRNDLVLTTRGTVGNVAYYSDHVPFPEIRINSGMVILRPDTFKILPRYLFLFLRSTLFKEQVLALRSGSAQPQLPIRDMNRIKMPLPSLADQKEIVAVLGALDDRITLLRETNATLEAIAQALFKSWFVDFDPVRAKQAGRAPEGMSEATAALFPDGFEESELGLVPRGWRVGALSDLATYLNGYAFKTKDWQETGHPVVKIGNVKPGLIDVSGATCVSHETVVGLERFKLNRGDLLVGMTGYVGETGLVPSLDPPAYLNQRVGRISTSYGVNDLGFIYCVVRNPAYKAHAELKSHGSAQANVSGTDLMAYPCILPDSKILDVFNEILRPMLERILENHEKAQTLASLRDTLLPRLISGQLRLDEVQAQSADHAS